MFGIGPQEGMLIVLLLLVIFGAGKTAGMAKDFGSFVSGARRSVEEIKSELLPEEVKEAHRSVEEIKSELTATPPTSGRNEASSAPRSDGEDQARERGEGRKPLRKEGPLPPTEASSVKERQREGAGSDGFGGTAAEVPRRDHQNPMRPL